MSKQKVFLIFSFLISLNSMKTGLCSNMIDQEIFENMRKNAQQIQERYMYLDNNIHRIFHKKESLIDNDTLKEMLDNSKILNVKKIKNIDFNSEILFAENQQ